MHAPFRFLSTIEPHNMRYFFLRLFLLMIGPPIVRAITCLKR